MAMLTVKDDAVEAAQCNHLGLSHRRDRHEGHKRILLGLESIEQTQPRVLNLGGEGCGIGRHDYGNEDVMLRIIEEARFEDVIDTKNLIYENNYERCCLL